MSVLHNSIISRIPGTTVRKPLSSRSPTPLTLTMILAVGPIEWVCTGAAGNITVAIGRVLAIWKTIRVLLSIRLLDRRHGAKRDRGNDDEVRKDGPLSATHHTQPQLGLQRCSFPCCLRTRTNLFMSTNLSYKVSLSTRSTLLQMAGQTACQSSSRSGCRLLFSHIGGVNKGAQLSDLSRSKRQFHSPLLGRTLSGKSAN